MLAVAPLLSIDYGDTSIEGVPAIPDLYALLKGQLDARLAGGRSPMQASGWLVALGMQAYAAGCRACLLVSEMCIQCINDCGSLTACAGCSLLHSCS